MFKPRHHLMIPLLSGLLVGCFGREAPEQPGALSNPQLAELLEASFERQLRELDPMWSPGLLPQAQDHARQWLGEIDEIVARCRGGPSNTSKGNLLEYDVHLRNGEALRGLFSGTRCLYQVSPPLVMRMRFAQGRVVEALTDGRELRLPMADVQPELDQLAQVVLRADWGRRRALYFPPAPGVGKDEWKAR